MKKFLLLLFMLLALGHLHAQDSTAVTSRLVHFAKNAALFSKNNAQEKVYLHFDNTGYFLGESIWFKAYVVYALNLTPSVMSKVLYVDLLTPEGDIVTSKKYPIQRGICCGDFYLADSLPGGFYEVRAYTRCMLNFGKETVFSRVFPVYDKPLREGDFTERNMTQRQFKALNFRDKNPVEKKIDIQFFPEGGSLVCGLPSTVAYKAVDEEGKSVTLTGVVLSPNKQVVASIKTEHNGMGKCSFTPENGTYTAQVQVEKKTYSFDLPAATPTGYVLSVTSFPQMKGCDSIVVQLKRTADTPDDTLALAVSCRGKLLDFNTFNIPTNGRTLGFTTARYPAGICQFTLYDALGRIRCERLLFVDPSATNSSVKSNSINALSVHFGKSSYKSYEKVKVQLQAADSMSVRAGNSLSVSIKDASSSNFGNSDNSDITTNLLLSSDLKGYIEDPAWYFKDTDPTRRSGLDLLLLTQGWRRYKWEQMDGVEPFQVKHPIENTQLLFGKVQTILKKKDVPNIKLDVFLNQGKEWKRGKIETDSLGQFAFSISDALYGRWDLDLLTSQNGKPKEYRVLLDRQFTPVPKWYSALDNEVWTNHKVSLAGSKEDTLSSLIGEIRYATETSNSNFKEYRLPDVVKTVKGKIDLDRTVGRRASYRFDGPELLNRFEDLGLSDGFSLGMMLRKLNPYIFETEENQFLFHGKNLTFQFRNVREPSTSLFQLEKQDLDAANLKPMQLIKKIVRIEFVEDPQTISMMNRSTSSSPEVFAFIYYDPYIPDERIGERKSIYDGYSVSKEFYHPVYDPSTPPIDPDCRRTLYWNPDVVLGKDGSCTLEFYNNRTCRKMEVSAEGLTLNGTLLLKSNP
jgi:hypothetical protein